MREAVRSGRRANFYITENRFIDYYAKEVGGNGVAVYSILQRCANSETRETWISAGKMAEVLNIDKSTVYRYLKQLEDLRLIKSMRTREKTIYIVLPVPSPRPEMNTAPLFDGIESKTNSQSPTWPPVAGAQISFASESDSHSCDSSVAPMPQPVASVRQASCSGENRNKEEQDFLNKTQEQDLGGNKTAKYSPPESTIARIKDCATKIVQLLGMTETETNLRIVEAGLTAEIRYTGQSPEDAAQLIARAASKDRDDGVAINKFYFEDTKWRTPNGGRNKADQQFDRINRARERAIENIKARSRSQDMDS